MFEYGNMLTIFIAYLVRKQNNKYCRLFKHLDSQDNMNT
jgi:hypothetical protein